MKKNLKKYLLCLSILGLLTVPLCSSVLSTDFEQTEWTNYETPIGDDSEDFSGESILLPRNIYILQGDTKNKERYSIFFKNALLTNEANSRTEIISDYGKALTGRWHFQSNSADYPLPTEPFDLTFKVTNNQGIMEKTTSVEVVDKTNDTPVRLLAIGDSLTRAGIYLQQIQTTLPNVTTVGTRVYPGETHPREGRGGWTLDRYFTAINSAELDSPFLFPVDVEGIHYKGNTRDWKNICYLRSKNAPYDGFQKMARGWTENGDYLYDENGYYKNPSIGDVMVDPTLPENEQWVEWNGLSWSPMSIQPTTFEFNFSKYMERFAAAFPDGAPTHISILLGANDFSSYDELRDINGFIDKLNIAITSIHDYDPNIKVIICTPTVAPNQKFLTGGYDERYTKYDRNMQLATYHLLKAFDNDESVANNIFIAPLTLTLDTTNGFDYKQVERIIDGEPTKVTVAANGIHPNNTYGQLQMGDTLAAIIQKYR